MCIILYSKWSITFRMHFCVMLCCGGRLQECIVRLEKEINLEYDRTMNRISFDRVVLTNPEDFSHITLPQREPERVPQNGEFTVGFFVDVSPKDGHVYSNIQTEWTLVFDYLCECYTTVYYRIVQY